MGNEMGNVNANGLGATEQDISSGTLEPSSSYNHDTGLRSSDDAPANLENPPEGKASVADTYTSEADANLMQVQGMSPGVDDEEGRNSHEHITLDTGEMLPNEAVVMGSDENDSSNEQLFSIEGTVEHEMNDKMGEYLKESDSDRLKTENGSDEGEIFMEEVNVHKLETSEKDSILKEVESHKIFVINESNVVDEKNRSREFVEATGKMEKYPKETISDRFNGENKSSGEGTLGEQVNAHEIENNEKDSLLEEPEAHVVVVTYDSTSAHQNNTEHGDYLQNGSVVKERLIELQHDSPSTEHESSMYLEAIDAQTKDALMEKNEEDSGKVSQGHELEPDLTEPVANSKRYLLENEGTTVVDETNLTVQNNTEHGEYLHHGSIVQERPIELQLDSPSIEHESSMYLEGIDAQMKDALMEENDKDAGKVPQLEGYELEPNLTKPAANSKGYFLENKETTVVHESNLSVQNYTEHGKFLHNGSVVQEMAIELQLDLPSVEHETSMYLEGIDVQIKDALMEENEEEAGKVHQLGGYELEPDFTEPANSKGYFLENKETTFIDESNLAVQNNAEHGEYLHDGSVVQERPIELQLDSASTEHESCMYLEAIDAQIKDALTEEKEEESGKVSQLEGYGLEPDLTGPAANGKEYFLEHEETTEGMCKFTTEFKIDLQIKDEPLEEDERETEKASPVEGYEFDPNPTTAAANHEEYLLDEEENVDVPYSCTTEFRVNSPINEPEEKDGQLESEEAIVQIALAIDDMCERKTVHKNEHFDTQKLEIEKYIKHLDDEKDVCADVHCEAESNPLLTDSETKETSVIPPDGLLEFHTLENKETQPCLCAIPTERVVEERVEKAELLIETEDSKVEELRQTYGELGDPFKEEPSSTNSVQDKHLVSMAFSGMQNTISPPTGLSEQDGNWNQPANISPEYFTGFKQACALLQSEAEEYKEKAITESYPEISVGSAENLSQPGDFSCEYFPKFGEPYAQAQSETIEKKEASASELDPENCIVLDFDVRQLIALSPNSPTEGRDTAYLLDRKDPPVNQRVTDDTEHATCMTELDLDEHGVNASDEDTKFSSEILSKEPSTLEIASEVENNGSIDGQEETQMYYECLYESNIISCGGNDQLVKSVGKSHEDQKAASIDHVGLGDSDHYAEISEYDRQSMINLNHEVPDVDVNDCRDTSSDFKKSVKKSEAATPQQHNDNSDKKPEGIPQSTNESEVEVKSMIIEHTSVWHSNLSHSGPQSEECNDPTELCQETPSVEIAESRSASKYVVKASMKSEPPASAIETQNSDSSPSQHMTSVKGLISVFERSGFDAQTNSMKPISSPQNFQVKSSKPNPISVDQCVSNSIHSTTLPQGDGQPNSSMPNAEAAKADLPSTEAGKESNQNQLPQQQKPSEEAATTLARTSSERLRAPLLSFFKDEVLVESQEKGDNALKKGSDKRWRSPSKKSMATSNRGHEKQKPRSSFFSNCMCCTTVLQ